MPTTRIPLKAQLGVGAFFLFAIISMLVIAGGDDPEPPREEIAAALPRRRDPLESVAFCRDIYPALVPANVGASTVLTSESEGIYTLKWTGNPTTYSLLGGVNWPLLADGRRAPQALITIEYVGGHLDMDGYWDENPANRSYDRGHLWSAVTRSERQALAYCRGKIQNYPLPREAKTNRSLVWPLAVSVVENVDSPIAGIRSFSKKRPIQFTVRDGDARFATLVYMNWNQPGERQHVATFQITVRAEGST